MSAMKLSKNRIDIAVMGRNIKRFRIDRDMRQKELAAMIGIDRTTLSAYENGKRLPDIYMLCRIADVFQVSVDALVGRDEQEG